MLVQCSKIQVVIMGLFVWFAFLIGVVCTAVGSEDLLCRVTMVSDDDIGFPNRETSFICETAFFTALLRPSKDLVEANQDALLNNEWYITFPSSWLSKDYPTPSINIPMGKQVTTISPHELERRLQKSSGLRRSFPNIKRHRKTLETKPEESLLLVLVSARNKNLEISKSRAEDIMFGSSSSAASQFSACSFGEMKLVRYGNGVLEVRVDNDINQYDKNSIRKAAREKVCTYFGLPSSCYPEAEKRMDHISYVVPFGLITDDSEHGFASAGIGAAHSIFQGQAFIPETILHELGHNFRLGHANENGIEYGDDSGQMGGSAFGRPSISVLKRCFNGWNMWEMGWLKDRWYEANATVPVKVQLATFVDYDSTLTNQAVNIRIDDYYVTYNVAKGMNEETRDHRDKVLVVKKVKDAKVGAYYNTELVAALDDSGQTTFAVQNYNGGSDPLVIKTCEKVSGPPDYAAVAIGLNADCDNVFITELVPATTPPTASPTWVPTKSPVFSPTPNPTKAPIEPTSSPTSTPTEGPTSGPSDIPSDVPSFVPTSSPTARPTVSPSVFPSDMPSHVPTSAPTARPTISPSRFPSNEPSLVPTSVPTASPTTRPTLSPSQIPSDEPSLVPTTVPTAEPSVFPSEIPSGVPTSMPSNAPSDVPTESPSSSPTESPSTSPTESPSSPPTETPSTIPSNTPTSIPTNAPKVEPTVQVAENQSRQRCTAKFGKCSSDEQCCSDQNLYCKVTSEKQGTCYDKASHRVTALVLGTLVPLLLVTLCGLLIFKKVNMRRKSREMKGPGSAQSTASLSTTMAMAPMELAASPSSLSLRTEIGSKPFSYEQSQPEQKEDKLLAGSEDIGAEKGLNEPRRDESLAMPTCAFPAPELSVCKPVDSDMSSCSFASASLSSGFSSDVGSKLGTKEQETFVDTDHQADIEGSVHEMKSVESSSMSDVRNQPESNVHETSLKPKESESEGESSIDEREESVCSSQPTCTDSALQSTASEPVASDSSSISSAGSKVSDVCCSRLPESGEHEIFTEAEQVESDGDDNAMNGLESSGSLALTSSAQYSTPTSESAVTNSSLDSSVILAEAEQVESDGDNNEMNGLESSGSLAMTSSAQYSTPTSESIVTDSSFDSSVILAEAEQVESDGDNQAMNGLESLGSLAMTSPAQYSTPTSESVVTDSSFDSSVGASVSEVLSSGDSSQHESDQRELCADIGQVETERNAGQRGALVSSVASLAPNVTQLGSVIASRGPLSGDSFSDEPNQPENGEHELLAGGIGHINAERNSDEPEHSESSGLPEQTSSEPTSSASRRGPSFRYEYKHRTPRIGPYEP